MKPQFFTLLPKLGNYVKNHLLDFQLIQNNNQVLQQLLLRPTPVFNFQAKYDRRNYTIERDSNTDCQTVKPPRPIHCNRFMFGLAFTRWGTGSLL